MGIEQSIQLYTTLFYVCIAVAIIGFGLAAFCFFKFKIPVIFALETGRARQKTVEKMMSSGDFGLKESDKKSYGINNSGIASGDLSTQTLAYPGGQTASFDSMETTLLDDGTQETTLLGDGAQETTLLNSAGETTVLDGWNDPETSVLGYSGGISGQTIPLGANTGAVYANSYDSTIDMSSVQIGRFDLIEETIIVNSDEILR